MIWVNLTNFEAEVDELLELMHLKTVVIHVKCFENALSLMVEAIVRVSLEHIGHAEKISTLLIGWDLKNVVGKKAEAFTGHAEVHLAVDGLLFEPVIDLFSLLLSDVTTVLAHHNQDLELVPPHTVAVLVEGIEDVLGLNVHGALVVRFLVGTALSDPDSGSDAGEGENSEGFHYCLVGSFY